MNNILKNIRENLPIITLLYYLLSGLTIWVYYSNFDVAILSYCNLNDIIAFPIDAIFIAAITPVYLLGLLLAIKNVESRPLTWFKNKLNSKLLKLLVFIVFVLFFTYVALKAPYTLSYGALLFSILLICWGLFKYILYNEKVDYLFVSMGFILFLLFTIHIKVDNIKNRNNNLPFSYKLSFKYNSDNVSTTIDKRWIGQTSEYIFLYNRKSKSTEVYKMSEIDSLRFRVDN